MAARARLEDASDLMAKELLGMAIDPNVGDAVKLAAIKDALDRGGLKAPSEVVVSAGSQAGFEELFDDIATGTRAESRCARGIEDDGSESLDLVESGQISARAYIDREPPDIYPAPATPASDCDRPAGGR